MSSLIDGNTTSGSGGAAGIVVASSFLLLQNSTVAGNVSLAGNNAGGIALTFDLPLVSWDVPGNSCRAEIASSTIAGNIATGTAGPGGDGLAGGLDVADSSRAFLDQDDLIAANHGDGSDPDVRGNIDSGGHNLIGDGTGAPQLVNGFNGDQVGTAAPIDPKLGPLQDNGGATPTMALLPGSPAIDAGSPAIDIEYLPPVNPLVADQRGLTRVVNGITDIGAFEYGATQVATITTLSLDPGPATGVPPHYPVLTITVRPAVTGSASRLPTGTVHVVVSSHDNGDGGAVADVPVGDGTVVWSLPAWLLPGPHDFSASYSGDGNYPASTAPPLTWTDDRPGPDIPDLASLTASTNRVTAGQTVTLTATFQYPLGNSLLPVNGGRVTFYDVTTPTPTVLGTVQINPADGTAVLTITLGVGSHRIYASYFGNPGFQMSQTPPVVIDVAPATGDVTGSVAVTPTAAPPHTARRARELTRTVTLVNTGGQTLQGPLALVVRGLRRGTRLRGTAGFVHTKGKRTPFIVVHPEGGSLAPGASVDVKLPFSGNPGRLRFAVFAGTMPG
jgi:hypothetical protein